jgi:lysophospholipase L1-like esterase
MSDVHVRSPFQSTFSDGPHPERFQPSYQNADRLCTGGNVGEICTRDLASATGASWSALPVVTKTSLGLGNVENTALSTWAGSSAITTIGPLTSPFDALTYSYIRVSFLGDSIVDNTWPTWPDYLGTYAPYFAKSANFVNYGISGQRMSAAVTNYLTQAHLNRPTRTIDEGWCFVHGGGNDISDGVAVATVYGYLQSLWASARADGYKVVAVTILPRASWGSASQAVVDTLNALILNDSTLYDYVVRADQVLNNPANGLWYIDTTHPTVLGAQMIAQTVATVMNTRPWTLNPNPAGGLTGIGGAALLLNPGGGAVTIAAAAIVTTTTDRLVLANETATTAGVPVQQSPRLRFRGHAWNTTATAADNSDDWIIESVPVSGAVPSGTLKIGSYRNGAGLIFPVIVDSAGGLTVSGALLTGSLSSSGSVSAAGAGAFRLTGRTAFTSPVDGQLNITTTAITVGVGIDVLTDALLKVRTRAQTAYASLTALNITATGAIVHRTKAGTPVDGDVSGPVDGMVIVDTTASKIWTRIGGVWKGVAVA